MSSISSKRIKKIRKELEYWRSELEYVQEILKDWHFKFEDYHRAYCKEKNINLGKLNEENSEQVKRLIPSRLTEQVKSSIKKKETNSVFKKIYKQLAKKIHPDAGGDAEKFKEVTSAVDERKIEKLLDMCDEYVILIQDEDEIIDILNKEILEVKKKIKQEKSTYSWMLYSCDENVECKKNTIKKFLKHLFNYQGV